MSTPPMRMEWNVLAAGTTTGTKIAAATAALVPESATTTATRKRTVSTVSYTHLLEETGFSNKTQLAIAVTGKRLIIPKLLDNTDEEDDLPIA